MRVALTVYPSGALVGKITIAAATPEQQQELLEFKEKCGVRGGGGKVVVIYRRKRQEATGGGQSRLPSDRAR